MRVIVRLLDQGQFLALRLIQPTLDTVCLLEFLESENEEFGIMLVRKGPLKKHQHVVREV